jgi:hypothetical protein
MVSILRQAVRPVAVALILVASSFSPALLGSQESASADHLPRIWSN